MRREGKERAIDWAEKAGQGRVLEMVKNGRRGAAGGMAWGGTGRPRVCWQVMAGCGWKDSVILASRWQRSGQVWPMVGGFFFFHFPSFLPPSLPILSFFLLEEGEEGPHSPTHKSPSLLLSCGYRKDQPLHVYSGSCPISPHLDISSSRYIPSLPLCWTVLTHTKMPQSAVLSKYGPLTLSQRYLASADSWAPRDLQRSYAP